MRKALMVTLVVFMAVLAASVGFAQEVSPPAPPIESSLVTLLGALGAVLIPWVVWVMAIVMPKIPRFMLPLLPVLLGYGADALIEYGAGVGSPIGGAGIALVALLLREVINTLTQHGTAGGGGTVVFTK